MNFKSFKTSYIQSLTLDKVVVISVLLVVGVGLGFLWRSLRPAARRETLPPLPRLEITSISPQVTLGEVILRASLYKIRDVPVYQYHVSGGDYGEKANEWAKVLGFSTDPEEVEDAVRGKFYLWTEGGRMLMINEPASTLSFAVDLLANPEALEGDFLPTFEPAAAIIERTLSELSISSNLLAFSKVSSKYLQAGVARAREVSSAEDADFVEVHFTSTVDNHPVVSSTSPEADPVVAWIGRDGKLLRLELTVVGNLGEKVGDYPLKSQEEVQEGLERGEGVIVNSILESNQEIALTTITQVSLGYLLPPKNAPIIRPIFILSGQARTARNQTGEVVIYLDALR